MASVNCPECGCGVRKRTKFCPQCKHDLRHSIALRQKAWIDAVTRIEVLLAIGTFVLCVFCMMCDEIATARTGDEVLVILMLCGGGLIGCAYYTSKLIDLWWPPKKPKGE